MKPLSSLAFAAVTLAPLLAQEGAQAPPASAPVVSVHAAGALEGYTLFTQLQGRETILVDMAGERAHSWASAETPGNSVYLLEDGSLLRTRRVPSGKFRGGGIGGGVERLDWDGNVLWSADFANDDIWQHHDVAPLPNGNVLVLVWESVPREDAIAAGRDPEALAEDSFWPCALLEVKPVGADGYEVVWEWHAFDHLIQDFDPAAAFHGDVTAHPERIDVNAEHRSEPPMSDAERRQAEKMEAEMRALGYLGGDEEEDEDDARPGPQRGGREARPGDWMHTNSVDYDPVHDLVVISVRTFSEFWILDHSTTTEQAAASTGGRYGRGGDLLYRWGNPRMYGRGKRADQRLFGQHDAKFVHGDAGLAVSVFNNGSGREGEPYSTVEIVPLPFDPEVGFAREDGAAFVPDRAAWTYGEEASQRFYSSFISGAQVLPNGNVLVCQGPQGVLTEVTAAGEVVWRFENPYHAEEGGPPARGAGQEGRPEGRPAGGPGGGPPPGGRDRGGRGPGGPGGMSAGAMYRGTRLAPNHPGLARLGE